MRAGVEASQSLQDREGGGGHSPRVRGGAHLLSSVPPPLEHSQVVVGLSVVVVGSQCQLEAPICHHSVPHTLCVCGVGVG